MKEKDMKRATFPRVNYGPGVEASTSDIVADRIDRVDLLTQDFIRRGVSPRTARFWAESEAQE
jgi:hypothetical protein